MVLYNQTTKAGSPVITKDGKFHKRILSSSTCDETEELTDADMKSVIFADGSYRPAIVINGQLPGPPLIVRNGTQVVVNVKNDLLMEGITLHWHGMVQRNTPWMDGVGMVSHCPINPGETFTYRFLATPPGTHWYHSHYGTQRSDGLYGALIVLEDENAPNEEQDFEDEFIFLLHDWMRTVSLDLNYRILQQMQRYYPGAESLTDCFYQTQQSDGTEVGVIPFVSGLINGKGQYYPASYSNSLPTRSSVVENPLIPIERFTVTRRKSYRFRVINAAMIYGFRVSIDQHELHVISVDGNSVKKELTEAIVINSGERFDFYIEATQKVDNFWIRAETLEKSDITGATIIPGHVEAILHYDGAAMINPTTSSDTCTVLDHCEVLNCPFGYFPPDVYTDCKSLASLTARTSQPKPPSMPADDRSNTMEDFINFHFTGIDNSRLSSVNGRSFVPPSTPPMTLPKGDYSEYMTSCDDDKCKGKHCSCTNFLELTTGNTVQIVLHNRVQYPGEGIRGTAHPVHFHGHHFYVMKMAYAEYDANGLYVSDNPDIDCGEDIRCNNVSWSNSTWYGDNIPGLNLVNPPMKDTVIVPVGGYTIIRFKADNPGWWFVHCHIEIHQVEGMAMMLKEGNTEEMNPVPKGFKTCGNFKWTSEEFQESLQRKVSGQRRTQAGWLTIIALVMLSSSLYSF
ncbi:uncharacterized protein LOC144432878 [Glandiceps talaboti]